MIVHYCEGKKFKSGPFSNPNANYLDHLVDSFESPVKHYDQVEDAVVVLRKTLAQAEVSSPDTNMTTFTK